MSDSTFLFEFVLNARFSYGFFGLILMKNWGLFLKVDISVEIFITREHQSLMYLAKFWKFMFCCGHKNLFKNNARHSTLQFFSRIFILIFFAGYPVSVSGMLTVPVSASMYQTVVANIQQINNDGTCTVCSNVSIVKIKASKSLFEVGIWMWIVLIIV